ncbi:MAG TPA: hypothetical protein VHZ24_21470 [Pirellulales bacterium]|jgi:hypothetical protein|nr:hypothetical protein [Pirellulales bacterium]
MMPRIFFAAWIATAVVAMIPADAAAAAPQSAVPKRTIEEQGYRVELDLGSQVLSVSVPRDLGSEAGAAPIRPTLAEMADADFVSASVLAQKAKQFDDGLYAAIELAAEQGAGSFSGKAAMLESLCRSLGASSQAPLTAAPATIVAAAKLGGLNVFVSAAAQPMVDRLVTEFQSDALRSKPLAFYTWSKQLSAIVQQDRMLQTELKDKLGTEAIVRALHGDPRARATYGNYENLLSRLTNPLAYPDLRGPLAQSDGGSVDVPAKGIYFFPPSQSYEGELIKQLYGNRPIPDGFNLADEMIRRIRSGQLSLKPKPTSGWYDYQTWALEPLVIPDSMPEASHLKLDDAYRKQLVELFKGLLALTRETHIKQVEIPRAGAAAPGPQVVIHISPELSAEPLATFYYRRAWSYVFIRWTLEQTFGSAALDKLHRLTAAGPVEPTLAEELTTMTNLFYGAHVLVSQQLGSAPVTAPHLGSGRGDEADTKPFVEWQAKLSDDPDIGADARTMVPVFFDEGRKKTKVWVVLGWASRNVEIGFAKPPAARIYNAAGGRVERDTPRLKFQPRYAQLAYPVTAEVYVTKILDRAEFRALCNKYRTQAAILKNLE